MLMKLQLRPSKAFHTYSSKLIESHIFSVLVSSSKSLIVEGRLISLQIILSLNLLSRIPNTML